MGESLENLSLSLSGLDFVISSLENTDQGMGSEYDLGFGSFLQPESS